MIISEAEARDVVRVLNHCIEVKYCELYKKLHTKEFFDSLQEQVTELMVYLRSSNVVQKEA